MFPSDPLNISETAVLTSGGQVQITDVELLQPADQAGHQLEDNPPIVWKVKFSPPTTATQFTVGQTSAGATEIVPLAGELDNQTHYVARVNIRGDNPSIPTWFAPLDMGDQVALGRDYIPVRLYDYERKCP